MKANFKYRLMLSAKREERLDTRNYCYVVKPLWKYLDGTTEYGVEMYKQWDREDIDEMFKEHPMHKYFTFTM